MLKTTTTLAMLLTALLSGCSPKADPKLAALERRLTLLEMQIKQADTAGEELENLREREDRHWEITKRVQTNLWTMEDRFEELRAEFTVHSWDETIHPTNRAVRYVPVVSSPARTPNRLTNGVPASVYDEILKSAIRLWPQDYNMQKYEVNKQLAAYLQLHRR